MNEYLLTKNFAAAGAIGAHRIVAVGAAAGTAAQAGAANAPLLGIADELGAKGGARVDVHLAGIAPVEASGAVDSGASLAADADGKAVAAAPASYSAVVDGAAANGDIAVAGLLKATDRLTAVIELAPDGAAVVPRTAASSVHGDGVIRCTQGTANKKLLVLWDRRIQAVVGRALGAAADDGDIVPVLIAPATL